MEAFKAGTAPGEANAPAPEDALGSASNSGNSPPPSSVGEGTGGLY
jgi:hypothetical protein